MTICSSTSKLFRQHSLPTEGCVYTIFVCCSIKLIHLSCIHPFQPTAKTKREQNKRCCCGGAYIAKVGEEERGAQQSFAHGWGFQYGREGKGRGGGEGHMVGGPSMQGEKGREGEEERVAWLGVPVCRERRGRAGWVLGYCCLRVTSEVHCIFVMLHLIIYIL